MVITGGSLITTNCSLQVGASFAEGLLIISNGLVQARDVSVIGGEEAVGTINIIGGMMTLFSSLSLGGNDEDSEGNLLVANGGLLIVTNDTIYIGEGSECSGSITITNATMLANDILVGDGSHCAGNLFIEYGTANSQWVIGLWQQFHWRGLPGWRPARRHQSTNDHRRRRELWRNHCQRWIVFGTGNFCRL